MGNGASDIQTELYENSLKPIGTEIMQQFVVIEEKQIFLPFNGYLLSKLNEKELSPVQLISFLTKNCCWWLFGFLQKKS